MKGIYLNSSIEGCSVKQIRVSRTPLGFKCPVRTSRQLTEESTSKWIPKHCTRILACTDQHFCILRAPCQVQDTFRMTRKYPLGARAFLRSQQLIVGCTSSSDDVRSCVGLSGLQATVLIGVRPVGLERRRTSLRFFKSQTTVAPLLEAVAKMWGTLLFQAKSVICSSC